MVQLGKNISFVGVIDYFEIWDTEVYEARTAQMRGSMSDRLKYVSSLKQPAQAR